jgi:hypothetical protein
MILPPTALTASPQRARNAAPAFWWHVSIEMIQAYRSVMKIRFAWKPKHANLVTATGIFGWF